MALIHVLRDLGHNPLTRRELRGLAHQSRDWRLWVGLRVPRDARGWGVPAVVWFAFLPYFLWAAFRYLYDGIVVRNGWVPPGATRYIPDILSLCLVLLSLYLWGLALALMAPALCREREKETWESLRVTVTSSDEILLGLIAGRLAPVLIAYLLVGLAWLALRPHYAPLLEAYATFRMDETQLAQFVLLSATMAMFMGMVGTAASAWFRTSGRAVAAATLLGILLTIGLGCLVYLLPGAAGPALAPALLSLLTIAAYLVARRGLRSSA